MTWQIQDHFEISPMFGSLGRTIQRARVRCDNVGCGAISEWLPKGEQLQTTPPGWTMDTDVVPAAHFCPACSALPPGCIEL